MQFIIALLSQIATKDDDADDDSDFHSGDEVQIWVNVIRIPSLICM